MKKLTATFLLLIFIFTSGCGSIKDVIDGILGSDGLFYGIYFSSKFETSDPDTLYAFNDFEKCEINKLETYENDHSKYNSSYFKDKISGNMLILYNTLARANFSGENKLLIPMDRFNTEAIENALHFLACDSPFVYANQYLVFEEITLAEIDFHLVSVFRITENDSEKTNRVLADAKKVVEEMDLKATEFQKMQYLYTRTVKLIEYFNDDEYNLSANYLFDAFVNGKTNCNGFSETFLLLSRLAGLNNFGADYTSEKKIEYFLKINGIDQAEMLDGGMLKTEYELGNTDAAMDFFKQKSLLDKAYDFFGKEDDGKLSWINFSHILNFAELSGEYYIFDATWERTPYEKFSENIGDYPYHYFAMSTVNNKFYGDVFSDDIKDLLPECADAQYEGRGADVKIEGVSQGADSSTVSGTIDSAFVNGKKYIFVYFSEIPDESRIDKLLDGAIRSSRRVSVVHYYYLGHYLCITF